MGHRGIGASPVRPATFQETHQPGLENDPITSVLDVGFSVPGLSSREAWEKLSKAGSTATSEVMFPRCDGMDYLAMAKKIWKYWVFMGPQPPQPI